MDAGEGLPAAEPDGARPLDAEQLGELLVHREDVPVAVREDDRAPELVEVLGERHPRPQPLEVVRARGAHPVAHVRDAGARVGHEDAPAVGADHAHARMVPGR
jgi:hypothetical protein